MSEQHHTNPIGGDKVLGDKVLGDKVLGDKITYYRNVIALGDARQRRSRQALLTKVKTIWIDGLLEHSLTKELRIALSLAERSDAVHLPLNALVQELRQVPRQLPAGTPIVSVFEQMGGTLLILGAPGAGKTMLLLELARDLIARAEHNEGHPIPVVFNLSSWTVKREPLKRWLVEELNTKYDVPCKLAQAWVDADIVLPLLDGIDEVAMEHRSACVEAINTYRVQDAEAIIPLAVCSRVADYDALSVKLRMQGAVLVQPLTFAQVDEYLARAGDTLGPLRTAIEQDPVLRQLAETPLMLSVMSLAYGQIDFDLLHSVEMVEQRRHQLFDAYVRRMFGRRSAAAPYQQNQTIQWLAWLAAQMQQREQTEFLLERLHPGWLAAASISAVLQRTDGPGARIAGRCGVWLVHRHCDHLPA